MSKRFWFLPTLLSTTICLAGGQPFPAAPKSAAEAEAQGLQRIDARTLARVYGGIREAQNLKGEITRQELSPDGKLI
jgi:hypothetical protein